MWKIIGQVTDSSVLQLENDEGAYLLPQIHDALVSRSLLSTKLLHSSAGVLYSGTVSVCPYIGQTGLYSSSSSSCPYGTDCPYSYYWFPTLSMYISTLPYCTVYMILLYALLLDPHGITIHDATMVAWRQSAQINTHQYYLYT
jgi:hypothetical protein